jgi:hypothetical protein
MGTNKHNIFLPFGRVSGLSFLWTPVRYIFFAVKGIFETRLLVFEGKT